MGLEQKPFVAYNEIKKEKTFTVKVTPDLEEWFLEAKKSIRQTQNSTALKQLAKIGYMQVLRDEKMADILKTVLNNSKQNIRKGITDKEYNI